jgi:hypothetical protein
MQDLINGVSTAGSILRMMRKSLQTTDDEFTLMKREITLPYHRKENILVSTLHPFLSP